VEVGKKDQGTLIKNRAAPINCGKNRITWTWKLMDPSLHIDENKYMFGQSTFTRCLGNWCCRLPRQFSD